MFFIQNGRYDFPRNVKHFTQPKKCVKFKRNPISESSVLEYILMFACFLKSVMNWG